jgi:hypothetical protein
MVTFFRNLAVESNGINPLKPSGYYTYHQFNIQPFYVLPTQCIDVFFCGSENKQQLFPYTALTDWFL